MGEIVVEVGVRALCKQFAIKDKAIRDRSAHGLRGRQPKRPRLFWPENNTGGDKCARLSVNSTFQSRNTERLICNNFFMCGRYRQSRRKQVVEEYFHTDPGEQDWNPRYNIAPTQDVPIIRQDPKEPVRELSLVRWELIPS